MLHILHKFLYICSMEYDLQLCIGSRLRRLSRIVDNHFREAITDFNITENQMTILFFLYKNGKIEQGKIGEFLALQRSTVSRNIKLLEKQNYLVKSTHYRPDIELTSEGDKLVKQLVPLWNEVMNELIIKLGSFGMDTIGELEKKLS